MKTIAEIEEDPLEFVRWARTQIMAECDNDLEKFSAYVKAKEAELRANGVRFVDFSNEPRKTNTMPIEALA